MTRDEALALDAADALAPLREQFSLPPGLIYLDGNSLGVLPKATAARVQQVVQQEWGVDLIRSWNTAGWIDLPQRVGDKIARLVGASPGELVSPHQARQAADGAPVALKDMIVTAAFDGYFYVQDVNRRGGIRVDSSVSVTEGEVVDVTGTVTTVDYERRLTSPVVIKR